MSRLVRLALPWGVLFGVGMTVRMLFDTFAPPAPTGYGPRSAWTTWFAIGTFFIAGLAGAIRTRQVSYGLLVSVAASIIGNALAVAATVVLFLTIIRHDAQMLRSFEMTGGWDETLFLPIVLVPVVAGIGLIGGLVWLTSTTAVQRLQSRAAQR